MADTAVRIVRALWHELGRRSFSEEGETIRRRGTTRGPENICRENYAGQWQEGDIITRGQASQRALPGTNISQTASAARLDRSGIRLSLIPMPSRRAGVA
ncbi:hypothetical protein GCM10027089_40220 [Nocardia thraciensis]